MHESKGPFTAFVMADFEGEPGRASELSVRRGQFVYVLPEPAPDGGRPHAPAPGL